MPAFRAFTALTALMVASGFAGLGYQIVWTQQAALWLGHEAAAVFAVITAFFGGLALGALALGARIDRSAQPERWYAGCEIVIAAWSLVLAFAMAPISDALLQWMGPEPTVAWQALVAFAGCFLLLLPATAAMGATLPAMERVLAALAVHTAVPAPPNLAIGAGQTTGAAAASQATPVAMLYASNTFGAVLGVLATAFWLVPAFGLTRTAAACAVLNLACAAIALAWGRPAGQAGSGLQATISGRAGHRPAAAPAPAPAPAPDAAACPSAAPSAALKVQGQTLAVLAATGFLGIGYEVMVVRVLSQVSENTVYTFAVLLAIYLLGTALGAALYAVLTRSAGSTRPAGWATSGAGLRLRSTLLALVTWACGLGAASLWAAQAVRDGAFAWAGGGGEVSAGAGATMGQALASEALPAALAFLLPTVAMGALFSHLATQARESGVALGVVLGANTLGAAAAPPLLAWAVVPVLGSKGALLLLCGAYLLLLLLPLLPAPGASLRPALRAVKLKSVAQVAAAAAIAAAALFAPPLAFVTVPEGGQVLSYREGALAAVSVVADADGVARLHINNRQQEGSSATLLADARQALLPLLLHPAPQRVLFLGLGTGVTAWAAAANPNLRVDAAELLPEVIAASAWFRSADAGAAPADAANGRTGPRLVAADARRFVKAAGGGYDLIVSDNFHPARSGSGLLYTVEHFRAVRARLRPGGLFCQWLPLHQMDLQTLRSVVQSFLAAYPQGAAVLATNSLQTPVLGLVARPDVPAATPLFRLQDVRARVARHGGPQALADYGLDDAFAVLGSLVADAPALRRFAGAAPLNTDDRPLVAYSAPRITYAPDSLPADRLQALLREFSQPPVDPAVLVDAGQGDAAATAENPMQGAASPAAGRAGPGENTLNATNLAPDAGRWLRRLAAYWVARDRFIDAGRAVRPSADLRQMLQQVQAPLLSVLAQSPDFRPAFDPLQRMAAQLARSDPAAAQDLLDALAAVDARRNGSGPAASAALPPPYLPQDSGKTPTP